MSRRIELLTQAVRECGSDHVETFGGEFTGDYMIQQDPEELAELTDVLTQEQPTARHARSYLGIGTAAGGTERFLAEMCSFTSMYILDNGKHPNFPIWQTRNKIEILEQGVLVYEHIGDSHAPAAAEWLRNQRKKFFDVIGIDGDHSPAGVRMDWALVQPYLKPGTLVWFHDIACAAAGQTGALELWAQLRKEYTVRLETKKTFGIGVIEI